MADKASEVIASTAVNYRIKRSRVKSLSGLSLNLLVNKTYLSLFKPFIKSTIYNALG